MSVDANARLVPSLSVLLRIARYARPLWPQIGRIAMGGWLASVLALGAPSLSALYFDEVFPTRSESLLLTVALGIAVSSGASLFAAHLRQFATQRIGLVAQHSITSGYYQRLLSLPLATLERISVGEVQSRLTDLRTGIMGLTQLVGTFLATLPFLLLVPIGLLYIDANLALLVLAAAPFAWAISFFSGRLTRRCFVAASEAGSLMVAGHVEALTHIREVKALGIERSLCSRSDRAASATITRQTEALRIVFVVGLVAGLIRVIGTAVLSVFAWKKILHGDLTIGAYVAFTAYLGLLLVPLATLSQVYADIQLSAVQCGRALNLFSEGDTGSGAGSCRAPVALPPGPLGLDLQDVTFGYADEDPCIRSLSWSVPAGSVVAIVGASGSGKSTLLRLLAGLELPRSGVLSLGGLPVAQIAYDELRSRVGFVWQEAAVFAGSCRENLTLGREMVPPDVLHEAVRESQLSDVIALWPNGLDEQLGHRGEGLSGGEKQRIALARVLLRSPSLLLLDEITAHLDTRTAELLVRGLITGHTARTTVFVTHDVALAARCERILVIRDGSVVAYGTPDELWQYLEELRSPQAPDCVRERVAHRAHRPPSAAAI